MSASQQPEQDPEAIARMLEAALGVPSEAALHGVSEETERALPLIDGYVLLRKLGEGGFGVVFEARQVHPIRRPVAVKILRAEWMASEVLARFEQERQTLALLNHPNIARIYDAGETGDGRPFIAMELVPGPTIEVFARALDLRGKVGLLAQACQAVAHAHRNGILHRDLKPSNILVAPGEGGPASVKVIDFGIAKALDGPLVTRAFFTRLRQTVGTPGYLAPERDSASLGTRLADTRSDVFALGAVLWELLVGQRPEVSTVGDTVRVQLPGAGPVPRDLRWIVERATAADVDARYADASALAADLGAWLEGRPVVAAPPTLGYLLRKWASRHRLAAGLLAGSLVALCVAAAGLAWQNRIVARALSEARASEAESRQRLANETLQLGWRFLDEDPLTALLRWSQSAALGAGTSEASALVESLLRREPLPMFLDASSSLPDFEWDDLRVSPNRRWTALAVRDDGPARLVLIDQGAPRVIPAPWADAAKNPPAWVIDDDGALNWSGPGETLSSLSLRGQVASIPSPVGSIRSLHATAAGGLWVSGSRGLALRTATGTWSDLHLIGDSQLVEVSADGSAWVAALRDSGRIFTGRVGVSGEQELVDDEAGAAPLAALSLSTDGASVAAGWRNGRVAVWSGRAPVSSFTTGGPIRGLALTREDAVVVHAQNALVWWSGTSRTPLAVWRFPRELAWWHAFPEGGVVAATLGGGVSLVEGGRGAVKVRRLPGAIPSGSGPGWASGFEFTLVGARGGQVQRFALRPAEPMNVKRIPGAQDWLAIAPAGSEANLIALGVDGRVQAGGLVAWRAPGAPFIRAAMDAHGLTVLADPEGQPGVRVARARGAGKLHAWPKPSAVALSADGARAALGTPDGRHWILDTETGGLIAERTTPGLGVDAIAVSDEGRVAAWAGGRLHLWHAGEAAVVERDIEGVSALALTRDGRRVAVARGEGWVDVLDARSGVELSCPLRTPGRVRSLVWTLDGLRLHALSNEGRWAALEVPESRDLEGALWPKWIEAELGWRMQEDGKIVAVPRSERVKMPEEFEGFIGVTR